MEKEDQIFWVVGRRMCMGFWCDFEVLVGVLNFEIHRMMVGR
jgi:hypothetical protein